ncbi:Pectinesterase [Handroanthus impetiginosus]|uniref:Pectinesterase n=1 Tax=Handroanthus impetiginosus TaxID=429701 RepID=A0A2G9HVL2_9LAMI|nr:Pectinesterase [Handroanthus impetiginosus]
MAGSPKKRIAIVSVCSLVLVAMVVALTISKDDKESTDVDDVTSNQKAIATLCQNTDYKEACINSLQNSGSNTSDPKELIELAFQAAIKDINEAAQNSTVLQELETDPRGKAALESCRELANRATSDLERSFNKFSNFNLIDVGDILADLKVWLSGAITYQETCLDGFDGVEGDSGQKMREFLTTSMQMTSNGLAMVTGISSVLDSIGLQGSSSRRLLSEGLPVLGHDDELPDWIDGNRRRLLSTPVHAIKPNLTVAKDGSGDYKVISHALEKVPKNKNTTFVLYIKEGVYEEKLQINSTMTHLVMIGDGPTKTRITGNLNYIDGTNTYHTATVAVQGDHFMAKDIGFENSAGPEKHQAVALRVSADKAIFYNCHMDGYQDTLYAHTYRQFYRDCVISGTIDFIFGDSAAIFQGCTMVVRKPLSNQNCIVTAQGRKDLRQPTGLVLQNCSIVADPEYYPVKDVNKAYLGRPWKEFSRTIIMESYLDDSIQPEGWLPWNETFALNTLFYTEFNNRGPGAAKDKRVKWPGIKELPANRIQRFTADKFIDGSRWVVPAKVPYVGGFIFPIPKEDPNVKYSPVVPEEDKDLGQAKDKFSFLTPNRGPSGSYSSGGHQVSIPESSIAASPWMEPYAPAPAGSYAPAPAAPSPVAQPKENNIFANFPKLFFRGW